MKQKWIPLLLALVLVSVFSWAHPSAALSAETAAEATPEPNWHELGEDVYALLEGQLTERQEWWVENHNIRNWLEFDEVEAPGLWYRIFRMPGNVYAHFSVMAFGRQTWYSRRAARFPGLC